MCICGQQADLHTYPISQFWDTFLAKLQIWDIFLLGDTIVSHKNGHDSQVIKGIYDEENMFLFFTVLRFGVTYLRIFLQSFIIMKLPNWWKQSIRTGIQAIKQQRQIQMSWLEQREERKYYWWKNYEQSWEGKLWYEEEEER